MPQLGSVEDAAASPASDNDVSSDGDARTTATKASPALYYNISGDGDAHTTAAKAGIVGAPQEAETPLASRAAPRLSGFNDDELVKLTGAPKTAWRGFFLFSYTFGLCLPLYTTVAVRLYTGQGYLGSLEETLMERKSRVWARSLSHAAIDASGQAGNATGALGTARLAQ